LINLARTSNESFESGDLRLERRIGLVDDGGVALGLVGGCGLRGGFKGQSGDLRR